MDTVAWPAAAAAAAAADDYAVYSQFAD